MIRLDIAAGPQPGVALLTLAFRPPREAADAGRYLAALDRIGAQDAPFLLLMDLAGAGVPPQELRREEALWLKRSRPGLARTLRGVAIVMTDPTPRARRAFARLFPVPVLVTGARAEAQAFLSGLGADPGGRPA